MIIKHKNKHIGDNLATPLDIFKISCDLYDVYPILDICANKENSKCLFYFDKKYDSLKNDWIITNKTKMNPKTKIIKNKSYMRILRRLTKDLVIWCNFPHSKQKEFIIQLFNQWQKYNFTALVLLPVNCLCNKYAKEFILPYIKLKKEMFLGRINFLDPKTNKLSKYNSINGYVCICYEKRK